MADNSDQIVEKKFDYSEDQIMRFEEEKKHTVGKMYDHSLLLQDKNHYESDQNKNIHKNSDQQFDEQNNQIDSKYDESFSRSVNKIEKNKNKEKIIMKQPNNTPKFASLKKWKSKDLKHQLSGKPKYEHRI